MVDVRRFVVFVESLVPMPQALTERGGGGTASEACISIICSGQEVAEEGAGERLQAVTQEEGNYPLDARACHSIVIVVGSQEYVIGRKLGRGAFGSVHEARLVQHPQQTEDDVGGVDMDTVDREPHTDSSCTLAMKLAGSIRAESFINVDLKLAAMA
eukprot:4856955-Amphidinium_carterae.1